MSGHVAGDLLFDVGLSLDDILKDLVDAILHAIGKASSLLRASSGDNRGVARLLDQRNLRQRPCCLIGHLPALIIDHGDAISALVVRGIVATSAAAAGRRWRP